MPDREKMLRTINLAYAARHRGDKEGVAAFFAPDATYRLVGTATLESDLPVAPEDAETAVASLIDQFDFRQIDHVATLIDGNRAALHMRVNVSVGDRPPLVTELLDLWTFDEEARIVEIVEFGDTALIGAMLAGLKGLG